MLSTTHVSDALAPFAALPDWLSSPMRPELLQASLREYVPSLADGSLMLVDGEVDQLRVRGDQWMARCEVTVAEPGREPVELVFVGPLYPPERPDPSEALPGAAVAFGQPGSQVFLPDLRLELTVETSDDELASLGDLVDPVACGRWIEEMLRAGRHRGAHVVSCAPHVARYKPGSRCTIVYDVAYDPPSSVLPNPLIAKTHVGEQGIAAHRAMTALWATDLAAGDRVVLAEPLGYRAAEHVLLQGAVADNGTLKALCHDAFKSMDPSILDTMGTELAHTAKALAAVHTSGATYPGTTTLAGEIRVARHLLDNLTRHIPDLSSWAEPLVRLIEAGDQATPPDGVVSSHSSFRPAQVLLGSGAPAVIDFDEATMAEPAMDVGFFLAGLRCIGVPALSAQPEGFRDDVVSERLQLLDSYGEEFLREYRTHAEVNPQRVVLWETLDLLASLLHTWTKGRVKKVVPRLATLRHQVARLS